MAVLNELGDLGLVPCFEGGLEKGDSRGAEWIKVDGWKRVVDSTHAEA